MKFNLHFKVLFLLGMAFVMGLMQPNIADAAEKKDKAARRAQIMMQKMKLELEAEKATMQAQFDAEKKAYEDKANAKDDELLQLNTKLNTAEKKNKSLDAEVKKLSSEKASLETKQQQTQAELSATKTSLADLKQQYQQAQTDLKFNDSQRKTLASSLSETTKSVNLCEEKNTKLHQFGTDLIKLYDNPSNYEAAMRKESFFQLKRVELENILQSKQDSLDDAKFSTRKAAY